MLLKLMIVLPVEPTCGTGYAWEPYLLNSIICNLPLEAAMKSYYVLLLLFIQRGEILIYHLHTYQPKSSETKAWFLIPSLSDLLVLVGA